MKARQQGRCELVSMDDDRRRNYSRQEGQNRDWYGRETDYEEDYDEDYDESGDDYDEDEDGRSSSYRGGSGYAGADQDDYDEDFDENYDEEGDYDEEDTMM